MQYLNHTAQDLAVLYAAMPLHHPTLPYPHSAQRNKVAPYRHNTTVYNALPIQYRALRYSAIPKRNHVRRDHTITLHYPASPAPNHAVCTSTLPSLQCFAPARPYSTQLNHNTTMLGCTSTSLCDAEPYPYDTRRYFAFPLPPQSATSLCQTVTQRNLSTQYLHKVEPYFTKPIHCKALPYLRYALHYLALTQQP